jgi:hypothetical protein
MHSIRQTCLFSFMLVQFAVRLGKEGEPVGADLTTVSGLIT